MNCTLIVFVKNPVRGKVKTRVAATVGDEKAVEVYVELLNHTKRVIQEWFLTREESQKKKVVIYYGDFVNREDVWSNVGFLKKMQPSVPDLGARMKAAFEEELNEDAERVVIVGSDCLALCAHHLSHAFSKLQQYDVVIGPADDGGYYLLGMKQMYAFLFENKSWSQPSLLAETLADAEAHLTTVGLGETLSDIDTWEDYLRESARLPSP